MKVILYFIVQSNIEWCLYKLFLQYIQSFKIQVKLGQTPLHISVLLNQVQCVRIYLPAQLFSKSKQEREMQNTPSYAKHRLINWLHSSWPSAFLKSLGEFLCALKGKQYVFCLSLSLINSYCSVKQKQIKRLKKNYAHKWNLKAKQELLPMYRRTADIEHTSDSVTYVFVLIK